MVTLVLVLLLKFCALWVLVEQGIGAQLLLAPLIGRAAMLGLFLSTPYVRQGGLGQALAEHLPRPAAGWMLLGCALFCLALGGWMVVLALAVFAWLRHLMCRRLGGTTGDTAGALLELLELAVVLGLALGL
ncbi:cobalamin synthase [compost metagenome]